GPAVLEPLFGGEPVRDEEVVGAVEAETVGQNADDAAAAAVQRDRAAHRGRVTAEPPPEGRTAHQDDVVAALHVLFRCEQPPELRADTERSEESRGRPPD